MRQIAAAAANGTQSEQTPVRPGACPGGCGLCCGVARLAGSDSVHGLVAADTEGGRRLYDPRCWSWEQLRQLIVSPTQAGFHVVHVPIRDTGEIPAANGCFDIAVLPIVPSTVPMLGVIAQSVVCSVRTGGLVVAVQPFAPLRQPDATGVPARAGADVAHCIEAFRASGCKEIAVLCNSSPRSAICDQCLGPASECDHPAIREGTHPAGLVVLVGSA